MTTKMPTFTPDDSALLLIDHQTCTMQLIKTIPLEVAKRNTLALAKTAKILNMPVVLTATNTLMAELAQDWSRPEGGQLLGILFNEVLPKIG